MADVLMLWDKQILFEKLFIEYGIKCQRISASSIGTPFLAPCKCMLIPTGFANTQYTSIEKSLFMNRDKIQKFVEKGGTLLTFGPMVSEYNYEWLPFKLKYAQEQNKTTIKKLSDEVCIVEDENTEVEYDGYFPETDAKVVITDIYDRSIMVTKKIGNGIVIASTIHELPSQEFLKYIIHASNYVKSN